MIYPRRPCVCFSAITRRDGTMKRSIFYCFSHDLPPVVHAFIFSAITRRDGAPESGIFQYFSHDLPPSSMRLFFPGSHAASLYPETARRPTPAISSQQFLFTKIFQEISRELPASGFAL
jgi:hypothetical protein